MKKHPLSVKLILLTLSFLLLPFCRTLSEAKTEFTRGELLADYDWLWACLEENDPFLPCLEEAGCSPSSLREEYRAMVETRVSDAAGLLNVVHDLFGRMGHLAHLEILDARAYSDCVSLAEMGVFAPDSVESRLIRDERTACVYQTMSVSPSAPALSAFLPKVEVSWDDDNAILYFHFRTFKHELIARDQTVVVDQLRSHPDARHIIFDITGNSGGSDFYWRDLIVSPFGGRYEYTDYHYLKLSPLNLQYGLDRDAIPVSALPETHVLPGFVSDLGLTHALEETVSLPADDFQGETFSLGAQRWLLTDGSVFSAADSFAAFCRETGWATVIGTGATMGDGGNMRPLLCRMPRTGLLIQFTTTASANHDGTLNALTGTRPNLTPKPRETPLSACLRMILK